MIELIKVQKTKAVSIETAFVIENKFTQLFFKIRL